MSCDRADAQRQRLRTDRCACVSAGRSPSLEYISLQQIAPPKLLIGTIPQVAGSGASRYRSKQGVDFVQRRLAFCQCEFLRFLTFSPAVVPLTTLLIIWTSLWNLQLEPQISLPNASAAPGIEIAQAMLVERYCRSAGGRAPAKDRLTSRNGSVINPQPDMISVESAFPRFSVKLGGKMPPVEIHRAVDLYQFFDRCLVT